MGPALHFELGTVHDPVDVCRSCIAALLSVLEDTHTQLLETLTLMRQYINKRDN